MHYLKNDILLHIDKIAAENEGEVFVCLES